MGWCNTPSRPGRRRRGREWGEVRGRRQPDLNGRHYVQRTCRATLMEAIMYKVQFRRPLDRFSIIRLHSEGVIRSPPFPDLNGWMARIGPVPPRRCGKTALLVQQIRYIADAFAPLSSRPPPPACNRLSFVRQSGDACKLVSRRFSILNLTFLLVFDLICFSSVCFVRSNPRLWWRKTYLFSEGSRSPCRETNLFFWAL